MEHLGSHEAIAAIIILIIGVGIAAVSLVFILSFVASVQTSVQSGITQIAPSVVNETSAYLGTQVVNETSNVALNILPVTVTLAHPALWQVTPVLVAYNTNGTLIGALVSGVNFTVTSYSAGTISVSDLTNRNCSTAFANITYVYGYPAHLTTGGQGVRGGSQNLFLYNAVSSAEYGNLVQDTNYTITDLTNGTFTIFSVDGLNSSAYQLKVKFTYQYGEVNVQNNITAAIVGGISGISTTSNYLPIVVLALILLIVLGLVFTLFPAFSRQSAASSGQAL
jgi:hypothetical protein